MISFILEVESKLTVTENIKSASIKLKKKKMKKNYEAFIFNQPRQITFAMNLLLRVGEEFVGVTTTN